ncbi:unnamed protein product [Rotaria sp. Silwood2]|nr:unnamed protein product [Rotaria sp. Silwood2]
MEKKQIQQQLTISLTTKSINSKITYDLSNVINISKIQLGQEQLKILSKGLKFVSTPTAIDTVTTIANCEKSLCTKSENKKPKKFNMNKEEIKLLKEIKSIEYTVIVLSDKGDKIIIMDKNDDINKIEEKLKDLNIYEQATNDRTTTVKTEINKNVTNLLKQNKYYLTSIDDFPKIRGQPKILKNNTPVRIVTCSRDTLMPPLSQFIFQIIKELRTTLNGVICNTSNVVTGIADIKLNQDDHLACHDIQDLY